ncbi:ABC transporter substrate-binding protein [Rhodoferax lacus]|nr:ABC transporter substrate binding protein [Rhodoferax lacus]
MRLYRLCIRLWLWACLVCAGEPVLAHLVTVVYNDKTPAIQEASDSLVQELVRTGMARQDIQLLTTAEFLEASLHALDHRLIVSLGTDAFRQVTAQNSKTALIAALIPRISYERVLSESNRKNQANVSALYLDQPFTRQLDLLRLALPAVRRVGVLWGPESITQQALLTAALQGRGLELSEGLITEGQPLIGPLRSALADADVLLAVADGNVYNASSVSNILLTSYRAKTPVLAFSPAYVKAGALLSVHTTAAQASLKVASVASHYLQTGNLPASQYPADFSVSVNAYVARSLGLSLDAEALSERLHKLEKRP